MKRIRGESASKYWTKEDDENYKLAVRGMLNHFLQLADQDFSKMKEKFDEELNSRQSKVEAGIYIGALLTRLEKKKDVSTWLPSVYVSDQSRRNTAKNMHYSYLAGYNYALYGRKGMPVFLHRDPLIEGIAGYMMEVYLKEIKSSIEAGDAKALVKRSNAPKITAAVWALYHFYRQLSGEETEFPLKGEGRGEKMNEVAINHGFKHPKGFQQAFNKMSKTSVRTGWNNRQNIENVFPLLSDSPIALKKAKYELAVAESKQSLSK